MFWVTAMVHLKAWGKDPCPSPIWDSCAELLGFILKRQIYDSMKLGK